MVHDNTQMISSLRVKLSELFHELMFWRFSRKHLAWLIFDAFCALPVYTGTILGQREVVMVCHGLWGVEEADYKVWRGKALH